MALDVKVDRHIAVVTLNRPEVMNAIDPETREELHDAFARIGAAPDIRVVVLTGAGTRAFCTGSDLKKTMPGSESFAEETLGGGPSRSAVAALSIDQPIICAINGHAIAGGLELALACDIRLAVRGAKFGLAEARVGSIPGGGGTQRLPRIVGLTHAMPMLLTGDPIDSDEAWRIGLVSDLFDADALMPAAMDMAERIAANAPLSVRAIKRVARRGLGMSLEDGLELERFVFGALRDSHDRIEGRKAFAEKRKPVFTGR